MYRLSAKSRATISSMAIFLSQQSRQYFSSPRGSDTSLAPHSVQRDLATALRGMSQFTIYNWRLGIDDAATHARRAEASGAQRPAPGGDEAVLHRSPGFCCGMGA